jgi:hypothetical protein
MARRFRDGMAALSHLLDTKEREPGRAAIRIWPDYEGMVSDDERIAFHKVVDDAAGVIVKRQTRPDGPADIRFVELIDAAALTCFLGRRPAPDLAASSIEALRCAIGPVPNWIDDVIHEIAASWAIKRDGFPGLVPGDVACAEKFIRILMAFDRGDHLHGWDMRTFSQRTCGDSKAVEIGMPRLVRALRKNFALPNVSPKEALASLGLEKFPQPVLMRGQFQLPDGTRVSAQPYLGLPPDWAETFLPLGTPPYVLVIENLASFNRHAREIKDTGVVIYSGGFPSRATLAAIRCLDRQLPSGVPFFHWGDTDRHGFLIHQHIAAAIGRSFRPHLMNADRVNKEQEALDPKAPDLLPENSSELGNDP